jgi:hypothetical protein
MIAFIRGIMSWIDLRQVPVRYAREPRAGTAFVYEMRRVQPRSRQRGGKPTIAGETNKANRTIGTVFFERNNGTYDSFRLFYRNTDSPS